MSPAIDTSFPISPVATDPASLPAVAPAKRDDDGFDAHLERARKRPPAAVKQHESSESKSSTPSEPAAPPPPQKSTASPPDKPATAATSEADSSDEQPTHGEQAPDEPTASDEVVVVGANIDTPPAIVAPELAVDSPAGPEAGADPKATVHSEVEKPAPVIPNQGKKTKAQVPSAPATSLAAVVPETIAETKPNVPVNLSETSPAASAEGNAQASDATVVAAESAAAEAPKSAEPAANAAAALDVAKSSTVATTGVVPKATPSRRGAAAPPGNPRVNQSSSPIDTDAAAIEPAQVPPRGAESKRGRSPAIDKEPSPATLAAAADNQPSASVEAPTVIDAAPTEMASVLGESTDAQVATQPVESAATAPADAGASQTSSAQQPTSAHDRTAEHAPTAGSRHSERGGAGTGEVERARFVQRVAKAFQAASDRGGPVRLRLSPPELGSVRLEVSIRDGAMTARLEAETPAARTALLEGLPALRERLSQQEIRIDRFEVDLMDQSPGNPSQAHDSGADGQGSRNQASPRRLAASASEASPAAVSSTGSGDHSGRLNVIV